MKTYKRGAEIDVVARLTVNHNAGRFTFRLCNLDVAGKESDECFEENVVQFDGKPYYRVPDTKSRDFHLSLRLPQNLVCNRCSMQVTELYLIYKFKNLINIFSD